MTLEIPMFRPLSALAVAAFASGCSTHTAVTTAHTIGAGNFQGAVEPGVGAIPVAGLGVVATPTFNIAFRYGVSDKVDMGARLGSTSYDINGKYMFTDTDGTIVSLAPSMTVIAFAAGGLGGGFFRMDTPLLIGIPVGESQFIVGPNWTLNSVFAAAGPVATGAFTMGPGAHLAYSAKMGKSFRLHPELSVKTPFLIGAIPNASPTIGFTLGMLFGGN
jgi:hypothetical protein